MASSDSGAVAAVGNGSATEKQDWLNKLRLPHFEHKHPPVRNANEIQQKSFSPLERIAIVITDKVGSMEFFIIILVWTILWCGYNILASEVPALNWKSFDPFPAFVAYLLISNVIQILLMPLIMVGQNLQGRHSEIRAELDFEINQKAEKEVVVLLNHMEYNTELLLQLMKHLDCHISADDMKAIAAAAEQATKQAAIAAADAAKASV